MLSLSRALTDCWALSMSHGTCLRGRRSESGEVVRPLAFLTECWGRSPRRGRMIRIGMSRGATHHGSVKSWDCLRPVFRGLRKLLVRTWTVRSFLSLTMG